MEITNKHILDFNGEWRPANSNPKKDGFYMTIRCGLGGIYFHLNEWKNEHWMLEATDASTTIAYSKEQIPKEEVNKWAKSVLSKVVTNLYQNL